MTDQLKFIVSELNREPFSRSYNLISFDSLSGEQLLQLVTDVLSEIEEKPHIDIRQEEPDATVLRLLGMLRILKYKPPIEISQNFREGLLEGHKSVVYPVLEWLLQRIPDLKKRAYLAKYLVKVDVPPEMLADADVADLYEQYEHMMDTFRLVHKETEAIKNSGYSTSEQRKDIEEMERERDIVSRRIERMQRKVDATGTPQGQLEAMLAVAKLLRMEKERERELQQQRQAQAAAMAHAQQRMARLEQHLADLRQASAGATPESLMQKLEEETRVNAYIVTQKLPKELESKRKAVESLQKVTEQPALGQDDISAIKDKISAANSEIVELTEKRVVAEKSDPAEDKLTLFRQQATIISRKKEATAERLGDVRQEVATYEEELQAKRNHIKSLDGETILRGDDFKRYVSSLRDKSTLYKRHRSELSDLRAEYGVLARTVEILRDRQNALMQMLATLEQEKGVTGFRQAQDDLERLVTTKADLDAQKGRTLEDMSGLVQQLTAKIGERKLRLAPVIKELRPLRQKNQELQMVYDERKQQYDTLLLQLDTGMSRVENEVRGMHDEVVRAEITANVLREQIVMLEMWQARAANELKSYVAQGQHKANAEAKKSVREQLLKIISEQEKKSKNLKEEQKKVKDNLGNASKQSKLWADLEKLLEVKKRSLDNVRRGDSALVHREMGAETLVL